MKKGFGLIGVSVTVVVITFISISYYYIQNKNLNSNDFSKNLTGEIVYTQRDNDVSNIYKMSIHGQNKELLYHNEDSVNSNSLSPYWSEEGTRIEFSAMNDGVWTTFTMKSDGSDVRSLSQNLPPPSSASRETDIIGEEGNLYYLDENGDKIQIYSCSNYDMRLGSGASEASWSDDKKYIIFNLYDCDLGGYSIAVANKKGGVVKVVEGAGYSDWKQ
jgi:Tol biopolymer transport system component